MTDECMLTTKDNPFDPFTQFNEWYAFDCSKNYGTCCLLARIVNTSDDLSDEDNNQEMHRAINSILKLDFENKYKKVTRPAEPE